MKSLMLRYESGGKRIIIAGSRTFNDYRRLCQVMDKFTFKMKDFTILSGHARGADLLGERWAFTVAWMPVEIYRPDYDRHGKAAPFIRNVEMAKAANGLVLFWDGESKGSEHMLVTARKYKLKVKVVPF